MFNRKNHDSEGVLIEESWKEDFIGILNDTFKDKKATPQYLFDAYGKVYGDEIVVAACYYNGANMNEIPVSIIVSFEMDEKSKKNIKKIFSDMMDLTGLFFEEFFDNPEFTDYEPEWQHHSFKKNDYYFKVTRENIALSLEAERLLKEDTLNNQ